MVFQLSWPLKFVIYNERDNVRFPFVPNTSTTLKQNFLEMSRISPAMSGLWNVVKNGPTQHISKYKHSWICDNFVEFMTTMSMLWLLPKMVIPKFVHAASVSTTAAHFQIIFGGFVCRFAFQFEWWCEYFSLLSRFCGVGSINWLIGFLLSPTKQLINWTGQAINWMSAWQVNQTIVCTMT